MKNTKFFSEVFILQPICMHSGRLENNRHLCITRACKPCATGLDGTRQLFLGPGKTQISEHHKIIMHLGVFDQCI